VLESRITLFFDHLNRYIDQGWTRGSVLNYSRGYIEGVAGRYPEIYDDEHMTRIIHEFDVICDLMKWGRVTPEDLRPEVH
jgi:hypothetical protein